MVRYGQSAHASGTSHFGGAGDNAEHYLMRTGRRATQLTTGLEVDQFVEITAVWPTPPWLQLHFGNMDSNRRISVCAGAGGPQRR